MKSKSFDVSMYSWSPKSSAIGLGMGGHGTLGKVSAQICDFFGVIAGDLSVG
jgi:hypothetical protein